ncbi:MAG: hypothetical protein ACE5FS_03465 [Paracoccaceae bacterium]
MATRFYAFSYALGPRFTLACMPGTVAGSLHVFPSADKRDRFVALADHRTVAVKAQNLPSGWTRHHARRHCCAIPAGRDTREYFPRIDLNLETGDEFCQPCPVCGEKLAA